MWTPGGVSRVAGDVLGGRHRHHQGGRAEGLQHREILTAIGAGGLHCGPRDVPGADGSVAHLVLGRGQTLAPSERALQLVRSGAAGGLTRAGRGVGHLPLPGGGERSDGGETRGHCGHCEHSPSVTTSQHAGHTHKVKLSVLLLAGELQNCPL